MLGRCLHSAALWPGNAQAQCENLQHSGQGPITAGAWPGSAAARAARRVRITGPKSLICQGAPAAGGWPAGAAARAARRAARPRRRPPGGTGRRPLRADVPRRGNRAPQPPPPRAARLAGRQSTNGGQVSVDAIAPAGCAMMPSQADEPDTCLPPAAGTPAPAHPRQPQHQQCARCMILRVSLARMSCCSGRLCLSTPLCKGTWTGGDIRYT